MSGRGSTGWSPPRRSGRWILPAGLVLVLLSCLGVAGGLQAWQAVQQGQETRSVQAELLAVLDAPVEVEAGPPAPVVAVRSDAAAASGAEASYDVVPGAAAVPHGAPLAVLEVPRWGADWRWALLEGVDEAVLADGPGHYPGTPLPGEPGNVGIAAHRAGHGSPFLDFEDLRPGDEVVLTQRGRRWTYRLTMRPRIVDVEDVWVLAPQPGHVLTLTTCWPKYGSSRRMFVRGELVAASD